LCLGFGIGFAPEKQAKQNKTKTHGRWLQRCKSFSDVVLPNIQTLHQNPVFTTKKKQTNLVTYHSYTYKSSLPYHP
jgi:hypothetical protein